MEFKHIPVLLDECIQGLQIKKDGIYEKITGIIPGLDAHSPKINVETLTLTLNNML